MAEVAAEKLQEIKYLSFNFFKGGNRVRTNLIINLRNGKLKNLLSSF